MSAIRTTWMQEDERKGVYSYKSMIIYKVKKVFKGIVHSGSAFFHACRGAVSPTRWAFIL